MCVYAIIDCLHLGWIEVACDPNKSVGFLKLESNVAGDFRLVLSLKVNYHGTWEVSITNVSLDSKEFSNFPELVVTLSDLKLILSSLDDMVICCGNNDTKFEELVLLKKGVFMDQSGMYALLHMHIFFQVDCHGSLEMECRTAGILSHLLI